MQRITTSTRAIDLFGPGKDGFKDGDLAGGIAPTDLDAGFFNGIQEEIANAIEAAGIALNGADRTQLLQALGSLPGGRLIGVRTFATPGTSTYTPTPGTKSVIVEVQGAGGGGGGCPATAAGGASQGGQGSGGGYSYRRITAGFAGVTITVGAGGTGVLGVAGNTGGSSSFGALLSATGGGGGQYATGSAGSSWVVTGTSAGVGSGGDLNLSGVAPAQNFTISGNSISMQVGSGMFAGSYGQGGGSATPNGASAAAKAGVSGQGGLVRVWEFS